MFSAVIIYCVLVCVMWACFFHFVFPVQSFGLVGSWEHLFPLAGDPIHLFKNCCECGKLRVAASYMILVYDTLNRPDSTSSIEKAILAGHQCALELLALCLQQVLYSSNNKSIVVLLMSFIGYVASNSQFQ